MKSKVLVILAAILATPASAVTVEWADWTSSTANSATGVISLGSETIDVSFSNSVNNSFVQTSCGTNYWSTPSTYQSGGSLGVDNAPTNCDIIGLNADGERSITLSETVENIYFGFVSWNSNTGVFSADIELLSIGPGYWGSGTVEISDGTMKSLTSEPHGMLLLSGPLQGFSFTTGPENWHGFTIGVASLASDGPNPIPLPASSFLFLSGFAGLLAFRRRTT